MVHHERAARALERLGILCYDVAKPMKECGCQGTVFTNSLVGTKTGGRPNMLERLNKEIRRRTRVVGIFPNPDSYLRLVTVYLMEYSEDWSVTRGYLSEDSLKSLDKQAA